MPNNFLVHYRSKYWVIDFINYYNIKERIKINMQSIVLADTSWRCWHANSQIIAKQLYFFDWMHTCGSHHLISCGKEPERWITTSQPAELSQCRTRHWDQTSSCGVRGKGKPSWWEVTVSELWGSSTVADSKIPTAGEHGCWQWRWDVKDSQVSRYRIWSEDRRGKLLFLDWKKRQKKPLVGSGISW